ncbi:hypothetical protein DYB32_005329 [Aphanomyces invadans]|uniref:Cyclin N-terminal domain-containing protein n=1 Tax=Aphanomyces invadans TaxID=157072 RepID=A0A3R6Y853_9STRA|nr:hypothetical protein DYB32_005329 [Aphanomyces invadans]
MVLTAKRSLSPSVEDDEISMKRCCRRDVQLTDKFTLHRGWLHNKGTTTGAAVASTAAAASTAGFPWQRSASARQTRYVTTQDRNLYVAALYTLTSNLGLMQDTIHMSTSLLDRFLKIQPISLEWLEVVSIACIWITAKFSETHAALSKLRVKETLQQRQGRAGKGNWTWHHVLVLECQILKRLGFRIMHQTLHRRFQQAMSDGKITLAPSQLDDAQYFLDLSLMDAKFLSFDVDDVVDAVVFLTTEFQPNANFSFDAMEPRVRDPVMLFFLLHASMDTDAGKMHRSLVCKHNRTLSKTWRHSNLSGPACACRMCKHVHPIQ